MAKQEYKVTEVDGKVRLDLGDGSYTDFLPGQANKFAGLFLRAAHEAVYGNRPETLTATFNFVD